jgi:hypothetical protein
VVGVDPTMKKEEKLLNKLNRLARRIGLPRWLHRFGPKKYEFLDHARAYVIKQECKLGYRRVTNLLRMLGLNCPCPSALCMSFHKLPLGLWQMLLKATITNNPHIIAIDGTGISRPLPSPYYYRRIDKPYPIEIPLKLSIAIDTKTKKIHSLRFRAKIAHDIKDARYLVKHLPYKPNKLVADKGYDAEWLHKFCQNRGIQAMIPKRDWGKPRVGITRLRYTSQKKFRKRTYHRREMVESTFSSIKKKFGSSVSSVKFSAQRAEMYCRAITHNVMSYFLGLFERSHE